MESRKHNVKIVDDRKAAFTLVDVITKRIQKHIKYLYVELVAYLVVSIAIHVACVRGGEHLDAPFLVILGWILPFVVFVIGLSRAQPSRKATRDSSIQASLEELAHLALKEVYKEKGLSKHDLEFKMGTSALGPFRMFGTIKSISDAKNEIPLMIVADEKENIFEVVLDEKAIAAEALHIELKERKF